MPSMEEWQSMLRRAALRRGIALDSRDEDAILSAARDKPFQEQLATLALGLHLARHAQRVTAEKLIGKPQGKA